MKSGVLISIGRYMPMAKASGGIFIISSRTASIRPTP